MSDSQGTLRDRHAWKGFLKPLAHCPEQCSDSVGLEIYEVSDNLQQFPEARRKETIHDCVQETVNCKSERSLERASSDSGSLPFLCKIENGNKSLGGSFLLP